MTEEWEEDFEGGTTLGPEEALLREIEKCKSLKVERLKLRDEIEQLREENRRLLRENRTLREKYEFPGPVSEPAPATENSRVKVQANTPSPVTRIALLIMLLMTGWLFYFFLTF